MRVALLNSHDSGGAGTATKRIHRGLRQIGVDSKMLVDNKDSDDPHTVGPGSTLRTGYSMLRPFVDRFPLRLYGGSDGVFSPNWLPEDINRRINRLDPDLVHLNWVGGSFLSPSSVADINRPIVWRFPDMWPLTGGCHYARDCQGYTESCGQCPELGSSLPWDLSRFTMSRKQRAFPEADITVAAPSTWLAECARESTLFGDRRIEVIPNGLDTEKFRPWDSDLARDMFGIDRNETVILFGSVGPTSDPRKGFDLLSAALDDIHDADNDLRLVIFGASEPADGDNLAHPTTYTGYLNDEESLALLYAAADVMVVPSRYEGFGQTVSEAMACGTPVVAFDATGPSDTVDHRETGYLAEPYDPDDLAAGIEWVLADEERRISLSHNSRKKAEREFALEVAAERYLELYNTVL
ncbi:glycosyltransferase family 4 protein [Halorubrum sp. SP9]|uniref:glycosyltransferase family 4 protein n=1 Tax=Halorubrum sp. SP9 TaxID=1537267 RepID=UPI0010F697AA|nr:glycosyltransferase family 4 protein [Halorubrum sp. SP9]TKX66100.1 glycosyltransferase [Halorubrum sp. SP9]